MSPHVLHDQHVDAGLRRVKGERPGAGKLLVGKERVERHEDARVVAVGVVCEPRNVLHRVAGGLAGSEGGAADVDGVGAVVDRGDAGLGVARRREEFKGGERKRRVGHEGILKVFSARACRKGRAWRGR